METNREPVLSIIKGNSLPAWSFDTQAQGESQTIDKITEKRYYIIQNEALQCLEKKYGTRSAASSENVQPQLAANTETVCSSLEAVLKKFEVLADYRSQEDNLVASAFFIKDTLGI
ncbi:hypothetical protein [Pontibacter akesuensis]|uniref:hypothetical protein n=1 Tax=Pontibacter akesuensis TaxID=388950 RepID=UPI0009424AB1|nr:hypothetical protein [Pontibacter akesuensis]